MIKTRPKIHPKTIKTASKALVPPPLDIAAGCKACDLMKKENESI